LSTERLKSAAGYSLVEVMVSIMILAIAIIPMVGMFDAGLKSATTSGNYDKARALANQQLEKTKSHSYANVQDSFPSGSCVPSPTATCSGLSATGSGLPSGSTYSVFKRFKCLSGSSSSCTALSGTTSHLADSSTDQGIMQVTVTVSWGSGNSYNATGIVSRAGL
jgi:prepilin-type N-terminal cleavage/methylation domain-containing protein